MAFDDEDEDDDDDQEIVLDSTAGAYSRPLFSST
jgi:hypothetical protein